MDDSADAVSEGKYWLTRALFLRSLGVIYCVAFISLIAQLKPLLGEHGLLPIRLYIEEARRTGMGFFDLPTIFWPDSSDPTLCTAAWSGLVLSAILAAGFGNAAICFLLWLIYLSFVNVGQIFYGYGWESLLLETGFLAIFFAPPLRPGEFRASAVPSVVMLLFLRWELFRLMFGAGLIKIRGDECWRNLTCLFYHYETQPIPNPLTWHIHHLPRVCHTLGVLFSHFTELFVPWAFFAPRAWRAVAGVVTIIFQALLILSGNLSWLNYLTIVLCIACFDDEHLSATVPARWRKRAAAIVEVSTGKFRQAAIFSVSVVLCALSINPAINLFSSQQLMNASFDPFHLVNTYGAFGSVGRERYEIVIEGTNEVELTDKTEWSEYEFRCKPGDVNRRPCVVSPFQPRLDWQIWFAAMSSFDKNPWFVHLIAKLLENDDAVLSLLANRPFPDTPPHFVRAMLYRYSFTEEDPTAWWKRVFVRMYMPPLKLDDERLQTYLQVQGWKD